MTVQHAVHAMARTSASRKVGRDQPGRGVRSHAAQAMAKMGIRSPSSGTSA